ncbi:MAG TPA: hypothetical protein VHV10_14405, partial [Ktedonobacteraceae bacterium]|nr:hypothetical protein [Ktedonobacteraceae bacterium]
MSCEPSRLSLWSTATKRRTFIKTAVTTIVAGAGGICYAHQIEPGWIEINTIPVQLPHLNPAFHGYRL